VFIVPEMNWRLSFSFWTGGRLFVGVFFSLSGSGVLLTGVMARVLVDLGVDFFGSSSWFCLIILDIDCMLSDLPFFKHETLAAMKKILNKKTIPNLPII